MGTTIHSMEYYREKERIAYNAIPGVAQILAAAPSKREKLEVRYPDAAFALMVTENLCGLDREQCDINQNAYFSILKGENISDVRFRYNKAMRSYVERHLWDDLKCICYWDISDSHNDPKGCRFSLKCENLHPFDNDILFFGQTIYYFQKLKSYTLLVRG